ncbi:hypothetical protein SAMN05444000_1457 [Shimia gijangensis]|uniref:Uncharacterized protein n=1 Tax=Shimia gijangensis TaxID=1470563 RepID=A0A1M6TU48_9RHOB|nr:hypothetical protein [Shimia gijangensis]SHK60471.1 hypothetical protein SAMN05444000_1457 [Shimia gijangensis]
MILALFAFFLLSLPVALAGVVYPFRPFRTRKRAAKAFGVAFLGIVLVAAFGDPNGQNEKNAAQETRVAAAQNSHEQTKTPPAKPEPAPKTEEEVAAEQEADRLFNIENRTDILLRSFDNGKWGAVAINLAALRELNADLDQLSSEIEAKVLNYVRPLPTSDFEGNIKGYKLLTALRPENSTYSEKVAFYEKRKLDTRNAAVRRLRKKEDKVEGVTFYSHPNSPKYLNSRSTVYLYIGKRSAGQPWLRMKTIYTASNWLFVNNVIAWHDGIKEPLVSGAFDRDHNSDIWEWRDQTPSGYQLEVLRSLANAREAVLRFEGDQYRKDVTLSAGDKKAIREVLLAYDVMKSGNW